MSLEEFVVHENMRQNAMNEVLKELYRFHTSENSGNDLPEALLPFVADLTFSDGAGFLSAAFDGSVEIRKRNAATPGDGWDVKSGRPQGQVYRLCFGQVTDPILNSHMNLKEIENLGISLPLGSCFLAVPIQCHSVPYCRLGAWRVPTGKRKHSSDSFQVWDRQALEVAARLIFLTRDVAFYGARRNLLRLLCFLQTGSPRQSNRD
jgi:hypothetical protein